MLYIIVLQTLIIIILLVLYVYKIVSFPKKQAHIEIKEDNKNITNKTPNFFGPNLRKDFRVALNNEDCLVEFLEFENKKLDRLKHKQFNGYLENISMGGIKLICSFDLPVKHSILIETKFMLKDQEFSLKGKIVRKGEYTNKNVVAYGVHFLEMSDEEKKSLNMILNQMILEKDREMS